MLSMRTNLLKTRANDLLRASIFRTLMQLRIYRPTAHIWSRSLVGLLTRSGHDPAHQVSELRRVHLLKVLAHKTLIVA